MKAFELPKRQANKQPVRDEFSDAIERAWHVADVAAYCGRCEKTVRAWAKSGVIPSKRVNRTYLFDRKQVKQWICDGECHLSLAP